VDVDEAAPAPSNKNETSRNQKVVGGNAKKAATQNSGRAPAGSKSNAQSSVSGGPDATGVWY
jgi:hypothetical protein